MTVSLENQVREIAEIMKSFTNYCKSGQCSNCSFRPFCEKDWPPSKMADVLEKCLENEQVEVVFAPDGVHELSPHRFVEKEVIPNATVQILECQDCGEISVGWWRNEDTI